MNKLHAQLEIMFQVPPRRQAILPISPPSTQYTSTPAAAVASGEQESRVEDDQKIPVSWRSSDHSSRSCSGEASPYSSSSSWNTGTLGVVALLFSVIQSAEVVAGPRTLRLLCFLPPPPPPTHARMDFYVGRWTVKRRNVTKIN